MPPSIVSSLAPNFGGQLLARIISFFISMYLLRRIDGDLLGIVNVSLTLYYTAVIFLVREPFRKTFLSSNSSTLAIANTLWLSPIICPLIALTLYFCVWAPFSIWPPPSQVPSYPWALFAFALSAWLESLAEPFVIVALRCGMNAEFALLQGILVISQRLCVAFLISVTSWSHISIFCYAQILSSFFYLLSCLLFVYRRLHSHDCSFMEFKSFRMIFPNFYSSLSKTDLSVLLTFTGHSLFKQLLTDGTGYVLAFTNSVSFSDQAAFDAVDKLGSLIARIVLSPLEHSAYLYFVAYVKRDVSIELQNQVEVGKAAEALVGILRLTTTLGLIICVFTVPYSPLAVAIYGGDLLILHSGADILRLYSVYVVVIAINGVTECFAMATMNNSQLVRHGWFLSLTSVVHVFMSIVGSFCLGPYGLILANIFNMFLRIFYSWRHTQRFLGRTISVLSAAPSFTTLGLLLFSLLISSLSLIIFGSERGIVHNGAHVAIGGSLLVFIINYVYQNDVELVKFINEHLRFTHINSE